MAAESAPAATAANPRRLAAWIDPSWSVAVTRSRTRSPKRNGTSEGLVYEMARRDHFRMDVIVRQAARLQEIDAELGEVEHLLKLEQAAAAGTCPSCGALYAHGAVFCWQCGEPLVARAHVEGRIVPP